MDFLLRNRTRYASSRVRSRASETRFYEEIHKSPPGCSWRILRLRYRSLKSVYVLLCALRSAFVAFCERAIELESPRRRVEDRRERIFDIPELLSAFPQGGICSTSRLRASGGDPN